jgi:predicted phage baseplate assembly protein
VSNSLSAVQPAQFPSGNSIPILLADRLGNGQQALATTASDGSLSLSWPSTTSVPLVPGLQPTIEVYYNLLPVSCGKTIANEILGSGDATQPGQSFKLSKSPVTYLATGSSFVSTVAITVNALPWTEVPTFYGLSANAQVFVTREDASQNTWVDFGDGINGARLTTGTNNVVATYRIGGGAASPPAGKLTVIAQSYPGLQSVVNPVAVAGGSDPDPAALLKQYAPRSVLAFGRAVSVFDFEALAAQASGVTMASATWSWDAVNLRASVTVYVAGQPKVAASVQKLLAAAGDPNRPVNVLSATEVPVTLTLGLITTPGIDTTAIQTAVQTALCDLASGLFSPAGIAIGQGLFDSVIEAACLAVPGVIAIKSLQFSINGVVDAGPLHSPGEGAYFSLDPSDFFPSSEVAGND